MADFADSSAVVLDVELLAPSVAGRLSPALAAGEQLLDRGYGLARARAEVRHRARRALG